MTNSPRSACLPIPCYSDASGECGIEKYPLIRGTHKRQVNSPVGGWRASDSDCAYRAVLARTSPVVVDAAWHPPVCIWESLAFELAVPLALYSQFQLSIPRSSRAGGFYDRVKYPLPNSDPRPFDGLAMRPDNATEAVVCHSSEQSLTSCLCSLLRPLLCFASLIHSPKDWFQGLICRSVGLCLIADSFFFHKRFARIWV